MASAVTAIATTPAGPHLRTLLLLLSKNESNRTPLRKLGLLDPHRRPVGADLRPSLAHLRRVEAHRHDRVRALGLGLLDHPVDHLLAAVVERLRHSLQLGADHRLQARAELRERVPGP